MPLIAAHDSDILIAKACSRCGGTPLSMPIMQLDENPIDAGRVCFRCDNTGREWFYLSDCWHIDTSKATPAELAEFNGRHGIIDQRTGGPRVNHNRKV